jgi:cell division protein FtsA
MRSQAEAMKVQFGSALAQEAKSNAIITIPGIRGMAPKQVSVKTLAQIIQARMSEILDFVTYHLKQVGMENRALNGGIILTGGGSQLKHLIQLTEYQTGLNARIGFPNEHLASGHIAELTKPMYSTCIGLILKGYNDYERNLKQFSTTNQMVVMPEIFKSEIADEIMSQVPEQVERQVKAKDRATIWEKMKSSIFEIFREDEDPELK